MSCLLHRDSGLALLHGHGLEIGAMHNPTVFPSDSTIDYFDVVTRQEAIALFPELPIEAFKIDPLYVGDVDKGGLLVIRDGFYDFVILNHVVEHVANPIKLVSELFRIVHMSGLVVISCPDKDYTFDKKRLLTSFEHLLAEYRENVTDVTDDHYIDFLSGVHPEIMQLPPDQIAVHVGHVKSRREHAHVWDSASFNEFLLNSMAYLDVNAICLFKASGEVTRFEYFAVWKKLA